jgi:UDP-glucuronate decarboxylase
MNNGRGFVGPVNLGNPVEFTIRQLAEKVLEMIPASRSTICFRPLPGDDPRQRCPDIGLAKRELGWEPKTQLAEGLERTIEYFRQFVC